MMEQDKDLNAKGAKVTKEKEAELYDSAVELMRDGGPVTASRLQRVLRISYPTAARLMDLMETNGVISALDPINYVRSVLPTAEVRDEQAE